MKLTNMFSALALTTALIAGCTHKKSEEAKDQPVATKPTEDKAAPAADKPKTDPAAKVDDKAPVLPVECTDYKALVDKAATCDKMPKEARDTMKQGYDAMAMGFTNATPDAIAQGAAACKQASEALKTSAGALCGW